MPSFVKFASGVSRGACGKSSGYHFDGKRSCVGLNKLFVLAVAHGRIRSALARSP